MTAAQFRLWAVHTGDVEAGTASEAVSWLLGAQYLAEDVLGRAARREQYALTQLVLHPEVRLDPRSELSLLRSLAASGLIRLEELNLG